VVWCAIYYDTFHVKRQRGMHDHNRRIMRPTFGPGSRKCWRRPDIKERVC
jgi:hypothetical protein